MKRIVGTEYPIVKQTLNTCGLASMSMMFFHHAPEIRTFLVDLYEKRNLGGRRDHKKHSNVSIPEDTKCITSLGYLLLRAKVTRKLGNIIKNGTGGFEYDDFKLEVDLLVEAAEQSRNNLLQFPGFKTLARYYRRRVVRNAFLTFYLDQFKTQIELKVLALLFGFQFVPYPGDVLGNLYFGERDADANKKFEFMKGMLGTPAHATLLGHGQSHWMVPHSIWVNDGAPNNQYFLGINDPLGSSGHVPFNTLNSSYIFYFFKFNKDACGQALEKLQAWFEL